MRPPAAPEGHPLAKGCPLGPRGALSPLGCNRKAAAVPRCRLKVADPTAVWPYRWRKVAKPEVTPDAVAQPSGGL